MKYTDKLYDIIDDIKGDVADYLLRIEDGFKASNKSLSRGPIENTDDLGISLVDVASDLENWSFNVTINGKVQPMKIGKFVRHFFPDKFSDKEIFNFALDYNHLKNGTKKKDSDDHDDWDLGPYFNSRYSGGTTSKSYKKYDYEAIRRNRLVGCEKITIPKFSFNPKDIRSTFLSLVTKTYPHPHEDDVVKFMTPGLTKDEHGNYYKILGKSQTMFTSHIDTADRVPSDVVLYSKKDTSGDEIIMTDGTTILGADDKSGVTVMMYMIANNIPGIYYFFMGEERGGIGSNLVADAFGDYPHLQGVKRCVSFDRRNYFSVITNQLGRVCCSNEFASALAKELNKSGLKISLDTTGVYTDSASFIDEIPECTNISVGYFNEHTSDEHQNISYLERLCKACLSVNWESLPTVKKAGIDANILKKHSGFISDFKKKKFSAESKIVGEYGNCYLKMQLDDPDIDTVYSDLIEISTLLSKHKMDPNVRFSYDTIKIELK